MAQGGLGYGSSSAIQRKTGTLAGRTVESGSYFPVDCYQIASRATTASTFNIVNTRTRPKSDGACAHNEETSRTGEQRNIDVSANNRRLAPSAPFFLSTSRRTRSEAQLLSTAAEGHVPFGSSSSDSERRGEIMTKRSINWSTLSNPLKKRNTKDSPEEADGDNNGSQLDQSSPLPQNPTTGFAANSTPSPQREIIWSFAGANIIPPSPAAYSPTLETPSRQFPTNQERQPRNLITSSPHSPTAGGTSSPITSSPQSFTSRHASRIASFLRRPTSQSQSSSPTSHAGVGLPVTIGEAVVTVARDFDGTEILVQQNDPLVASGIPSNAEQEGATYNISQVQRSSSTKRTHTTGSMIVDRLDGLSSSLQTQQSLQSQQQRRMANYSPEITPISSSSTWPGADRNMAMLFSPVSPPSAFERSPEQNEAYRQGFIDAMQHAQRTATSSLYRTPTPPRPVSLDNPSQAVIETDITVQKDATDVEMEADFDSPSDFALFAEATASLGFFLGDSFSTSPVEGQYTQPSRRQSPQPLLPLLNTGSPSPRISSIESHDAVGQSSTLPTMYPQDASSFTDYSHQYENSHLLPREEYAQPRSRSVPPPAFSNSHSRSTSNPAPTRSSRFTSPPFSRLRAQPSYQQLRSSSQQAQSRVITGAFPALGVIRSNQDDIMDDELPDYAQSQAEATERQRVEAMSRARQLEEGWLRGRADRIKKPWRAWERGNGF
jgi:hypothetical protein